MKKINYDKTMSKRMYESVHGEAKAVRKQNLKTLLIISALAFVLLIPAAFMLSTMLAAQVDCTHEHTASCYTIAPEHICTEADGCVTYPTQAVVIVPAYNHTDACYTDGALTCLLAEAVEVTDWVTDFANPTYHCNAVATALVCEHSFCTPGQPCSVSQGVIADPDPQSHSSISSLRTPIRNPVLHYTDLPKFTGSVRMPLSFSSSSLSLSRLNAKM